MWPFVCLAKSVCICLWCQCKHVCIHANVCVMKRTSVYRSVSKQIFESHRQPILAGFVFLSVTMTAVRPPHQ